MLKSLGLWKKGSATENESSGTEPSILAEKSLPINSETDIASSSGTCSISIGNHEQSTLTQGATVSTGTVSPMGSSFESIISRDRSSVVTDSTLKSSMIFSGNTTFHVSDIHYSQPYLESHAMYSFANDISSNPNDVSSFDQDFIRQFSDFSSFTSNDPRSLQSILPLKWKDESTPSESTQKSVRKVEPSEEIYQEPYHHEAPIRRNTETAVHKKMSLLDTHQGRHSSAGSQRLSFLEVERRQSQFRRSSLAAYSSYSENDMSNSIKLNFNLNLRKLKTFKPPNLNELRDQLRKMPVRAKKR